MSFKDIISSSNCYVTIFKQENILVNVNINELYKH